MKLVSTRANRDCEQDSIKAHVIEVMGRDIWEQLVASFGGLTLDVPWKPETLHPQHALVLALGEKYARIYQDVFAGERQYIPLPTGSRAAAYADAISAGLTNAEIAKEFGMTDRGVRMALGRLGLKNPNKANQVQGTLSAEEVSRRLSLYARYLAGEFPSAKAAAKTIGLSAGAFIFTALKHGMPPVRLARARTKVALSRTVAGRADAVTAVSNAGLTGLGHPSGTLRHPVNENRPTAP